MLLSAENITKNYGIKELLSDVSVFLNAGDKIGIIGVNGTGKSTLLRILAGEEELFDGKLTNYPNVRLSYLSQNPPLNEDFTVLEEVFAGFSPEFRQINEYEAKAMLNKLGLMEHDKPVSALSGGQKKRLALVKTLIHPSDVLILDEPTNHLDSDMVIWLEDRLIKFSGGIVMVTHDRYFLERVVNKICELSRGRLYTYEANFSQYLELKSQREEMADATERKRQAILKKEYKWIMRGARARSTKARGRIERYEALKALSAPEHDSKVKISAPESRLGRKTIELKNVTKIYGDREVIKDFSYNILRDDRIGVVGKNGAGKTTLLNLIAQRILPDKGEVDAGATVRLGYFSQEGRELDLEARPHDFIKEIASSVKTGEGVFSATQMLERFLFTSEMQFTRIGRLSGGERRRLYLLSVLMSAPNILLLDEPTNDLDIDTLMILEDYLETFSGAVIAVSHDRYFLDKIAQSIFEVRDDGNIVRYTGSFSDYLEKREETAENAPKKEKSAEKKEWRTKQTKLKFSYKEQREFETIDDDIEDLENQISALDEEMSLSQTDYVKLQELSEKKEELEALLEEKTERWVYLNELNEKIQNQDK